MSYQFYDHYLEKYLVNTYTVLFMTYNITSENIQLTKSGYYVSANVIL